MIYGQKLKKIIEIMIFKMKKKKAREERYKER